MASTERAMRIAKVMKTGDCWSSTDPLSVVVARAESTTTTVNKGPTNVKVIALRRIQGDTSSIQGYSSRISPTHRRRQIRIDWMPNVKVM